MNTNCNSNVSKAQALALASYLSLQTSYHYTLSVAENFCYVVIFTNTLGELVSIKSEVSLFVTYGCEMRETYLEDSECWTYEIQYPCVFSRSY